MYGYLMQKNPWDKILQNVAKEQDEHKKDLTRMKQAIINKT